ncbi:response regulator transcription factor [Streptomyces sp. NPDC088124]|uniref:response regulator transcription factor n=1 Tax=Streptomyces sp. NPDC088124 TaxID=3154654 RepID=UPI003435E5BB
MITVLLADDEHLIRGALASLLALEDDITVVAQAGTGDAAVDLACTHRPDVAVLDLQMPGLDGLTVAERLRTLAPGCASVIVTGHARAGALNRALSVGVLGFVSKTVSARHLAQIIRTVHTGHRYIDPDIAADAIDAGASPLTPREAELLSYAEEGVPVAEIASRTSLSAGTVRDHLSAAATKLGAANGRAAARIARGQGWL